MADATLSMVPPRRLGALLTDARITQARSLDDLARASRFSPRELADLEAGGRVLTEREVDEVLAIYGVDAADLVPERAALVIDLDEARLVAGGEARALAGAAPTADEVLAAYLSLVYTLRRARPGSVVTLRDADVDVLARSLHLAQPDVERRLHELMIEPDGLVSDGVRRLRHRVLLPVIGVVVAATAVGTLLLVQARDDTAPPAAPTATVGEDTQLGPASVQQRDDSGQPGPMVVVGEGIPADEVPDGAVNLGVPQVAVRNSDGSVTQTDRPADVQPDPTAASSTTTTTAASTTGKAPSSVAPTTTIIIGDGPVGDLQPGEYRLGDPQPPITNPG